MSLMETLTLFLVIFGLLELIIDVIHLTLEVMEKASQRKSDDNKKD